jgi:hypothetical protein
VPGKLIRKLAQINSHDVRGMHISFSGGFNEQQSDESARDLEVPNTVDSKDDTARLHDLTSS